MAGIPKFVFISVVVKNNPYLLYNIHVLHQPITSEIFILKEYNINYAIQILLQSFTLWR